MDGKQLRRARVTVGLTGVELSRVARVNRSTLSLAESGCITLSPEQERRVRAALLRAARRRRQNCVAMLATLGAGERAGVAAV